VKHIPAPLLPLLLVFTLSACGDDFKEGAGGPSGPMTPNNPNMPISPGTAAEAEMFYGQAFELAAKGLCRQVFSCPKAANPLFVQIAGRYPSESACAGPQGIGALLGDLSGDALVAVKAGRQQFDKNAAQRCLDAVRAASQSSNACDASLLDGAGQLDVCERIFVGAVATDGGCTQDEDCAGKLNGCVEEPGQCYGTCQQLEEDSCASCAATQYCGYDEMSGARSCIERAAAGGACEDDEECVSGARCIDQSCVALRSVAAGGACDDTDQVCASGLRCVDGTCGETTLLQSGAACSPDAEQGICVPGLACALTPDGTGSCAPVKSSGASCLSPLECQAGLTCVTAQPGMPGQCGPAKAVGQQCDNSFDCASFRCDQGLCVGPSSGDQACMIPAGS
jgi:hypothetical protein